MGDGTSTWSSTGRQSTDSFRFFETESIAVITMMVLKYRVEIKEESEFIGETFEQRFARITSSEQKLTNTYAICSFSCCHGLSSLSAPLACLWYSRGDDRSIKSSPFFISSDPFYNRQCIVRIHTVACELRSIYVHYSKRIVLLNET